MAILFAVTYPDRVLSLTLNGTYASLIPADILPDELQAIRDRQAFVANQWGTPDSPIVDRFAPSMASNLAFRTWHQKYERNSASTESLRDLLELSLGMDVHEVLPNLDVPTLVLHRMGDQVVPIAYGRELAELIPGARLLELPGDDHFSYAGDVDTWMDEFERFVTGEVKPRTDTPPVTQGVTIRTLGRFDVEVGGETVPANAWGSRRARQLCKRLVAARGWPVTRDELIDMLWPDEHDMTRLSARLSVQLSGVRRVLGGGVVADRQSVRLDLDVIHTDLEAFQEATDDAAIVAAYTGEFLPDDRHEDWSRAVRDEARTRFVTAARRQAQQFKDDGQPLRAASLARRLVEVDHYDDASHRLLVRSLLAADEAGEARRAHETWATAMAEIDVTVPPFD